MQDSPPDIDLDRLMALGLATRFEYHRKLKSTNDRARDLAADTLPDEVVLILAEEQTAGRGRGDNRWWTGRGSLAMSLLFDPQRWTIEQRYNPMISLAAAVAVVESVEPLVAGGPL